MVLCQLPEIRKEMTSHSLVQFMMIIYQSEKHIQREREREIHRDRETERDRDRETETERHRDRDRERQRQTDRQTDRQMSSTHLAEIFQLRL